MCFCDNPENRKALGWYNCGWSVKKKKKSNALPFNVTAKRQKLKKNKTKSLMWLWNIE